MMWRRISCFLLCITLLVSLAGCSREQSAEDAALDVRDTLLAMNSLTGSAEITADYGVRVYHYSLDLTYWRAGDLAVTITAPETLAGITARLHDGAASISYDGMQVETGALTTGGLSPLESVPSLLKAAEEGYVAETSFELVDGMDLLRVTYRATDARPGVGEEATLWFDPLTSLPVEGEILSDGYRVINVTFHDLMMN